MEKVNIILSGLTNDTWNTEIPKEWLIDVDEIATLYTYIADHYPNNNWNDICINNVENNNVYIDTW